jgi:quinol monooxygenase YgiN
MPGINDEELSMAYCIAVRWTINPGEEQRVRELADSMLAPSNAEPGCQAYILHTDPADPSALFLYEQYDDEAAFQAHCDSPTSSPRLRARSSRCCPTAASRSTRAPSALVPPAAGPAATETSHGVVAETPRVLPALVVAGGLPDGCGPVWLSMVLAPSGPAHLRARPIR